MKLWGQHFGFVMPSRGSLIVLNVGTGVQKTSQTPFAKASYIADLVSVMRPTLRLWPTMPTGRQENPRLS